MMTLVRWHCAADVRLMPYEMNRLVHELLQGGRWNKSTGQPSRWTPAVDLSENDQAFTLTAELPGFSKDDVQVELHDNRLTLKGERKHAGNVQEKHYYRVERVYGAFERSITLPVLVDADKVHATFKDGVLKLTLPKAEMAKPKSIGITA
jgi:HSP20 family protein